MPCQECDDGEGGSIYPHYGVAPHKCYYQTPDALLGTSVLLPKDQWPKNFEPDPGEPECGVYLYCESCKQTCPD